MGIKMENKFFYRRVINVLLIAIMLVTYQGIVKAREKTEEVASLTVELTAAKATIEHVKAQAAGSSFAIGQSTEESTKESTKESTEAAGSEGSNALEGIYVDGTYTGEADGFGGPISVEVEILEGRIETIKILSAKEEDEAYLNMATSIIDDIVEQQSAEVDTVSGATFSSAGIKNATEKALDRR